MERRPVAISPTKSQPLRNSHAPGRMDVAVQAAQQNHVAGRNIRSDVGVLPDRETALRQA